MYTDLCESFRAIAGNGRCRLREEYAPREPLANTPRPAARDSWPIDFIWDRSINDSVENKVTAGATSSWFTVGTWCLLLLLLLPYSLLSFWLNRRCRDSLSCKALDMIIALLVVPSWW